MQLLLFHDVSRAGLVTATEAAAAAAAIGMVAGIATQVPGELLGQEEGEECAGTRNTSEYINTSENMHEKGCENISKHQKAASWTSL